MLFRSQRNTKNIAPIDQISEIENLRIIAKVAHLYYSVGLDQVEIASRLEISQARVSRLLSSAKELGIIKSVVLTPEGLFSDLERAVEEKYGFKQVHVVDINGETESELMHTLGDVLASVFVLLPIENRSIGFTSWSRSFRNFVSALQSSKKIQVKKVVELLGGVGQPALQHLTSSATENFARITDSEAIFLRVPGVVKSKEMRDVLTKNYSQTQKALSEFPNLDVAMVGIGR